MDAEEQAAKEAALYERLVHVLRARGYMTWGQCSECAEDIINELKKAANEN